METIRFVAISDIGSPMRVRLLLHSSQQGVMPHAPLTSLMQAAFVREEGVGQNGAHWRQYADGTMMQWGRGQGVDQLVTFPREFEQACWHVSLTNDETAGADKLVVRSALQVTKASFIAEGRFVDFTSGGVMGGSAITGFRWLAWGI